LSAPVDLSHAPVPTSSDERLAFRQLFETLVRLDCLGELRPGVATSWASDSAGLTWTFGIREGARFPDGSALTAHGIESDWDRRLSALQAQGLDSVHAVDDRTLVVTMRDERDSLPRVFAGPIWSVLPSEQSTSGLQTRITVTLGAAQPTLQLLAWPGGDLRDALDAGSDVVVSRDPQVTDYAEGRGDFRTFPLPWDRTYVLLEPAGSQGLRVPVSDSTVHSSLARDAVQTEARPALSRYWWNGPCSTQTSTVVTFPKATRLVYQRTDPVARQLAERLVVLAGDRPPLSATGLDPARFAEALNQGNDLGYIVAVPFRSTAPCRESAEWTRGVSLTPLIDTRAQALVRRGSPVFIVDWDGTIRIPLPDDTTQENPR
jgi:Bacterial extracellular solute-binding proteins, family 5 Middle